MFTRGVGLATPDNIAMLCMGMPILHYNFVTWTGGRDMEGTGIVRKLGEGGGIYRPELDGNKHKRVEHTRNYYIVQCPGSVNPYSYPCRHVRASDLWCRRRRCVRSLRTSLSIARTAGSSHLHSVVLVAVSMLMWGWMR